jgi:hypothetical protein
MIWAGHVAQLETRRNPYRTTRRDSEPNQTPVQWVTGLFHRVLKQQGHKADYSASFSSEGTAPENTALRKLDQIPTSGKGRDQWVILVLSKGPNRVSPYPQLKTRRMTWAGDVAQLGTNRNAYRLLVGKPEGNRPLVGPRRRWVDNIKMDFGEIGWSGVDWICLAQAWDNWRASKDDNLSVICEPTAYKMWHPRCLITLWDSTATPLPKCKSRTKLKFTISHLKIWKDNGESIHWVAFQKTFLLQFAARLKARFKGVLSFIYFYKGWFSTWPSLRP